MAQINNKLVWLLHKLKSIRPPEPYKGKGIKEKGQYILRKEGKKKIMRLTTIERKNLE